MREYGSNINLPSLDNLFSSEQERQDTEIRENPNFAADGTASLSESPFSSP